MITLLKYFGIIGVLLAITSFMPRVVPAGTCGDTGNCVTLPEPLENAFSFFVNSIKGIIELLPFLEIVWTLIVWALVIEVALFTWHWLRWLLELMR